MYILALITVASTSIALIELGQLSIIPVIWFNHSHPPCCDMQGESINSVSLYPKLDRTLLYNDRWLKSFNLNSQISLSFNVILLLI